MAESLWGAIIGASSLAVLVNIVELLCTAGLPAMYTGDAMETVHKFAAAAGMEADARLWALTVEAGISHHRAATEWVEHAIGRLEQMDDSMFGAVPVIPGDTALVDARTAQKVLDRIAEDKPGVRVSTQGRKSKNGNNAVAAKGASS